MSMLRGNYFHPRASRFEAAEAHYDEGTRTLRVVRGDGTIIDQAPARAVRPSLRLGHLMRHLAFPGGARFDVAGNDDVDAFLRAARMRVRGAVIDRLERSWITVAVAIGLALIAGYLAFALGIPALAQSLAERTPPSVSEAIAGQSMVILDNMAFSPSQLPAADQAKAEALFARVAREGKLGAGAYRLVFRHGGSVGPNALALPDGTIIMTDEMWPYVKRDDEILGVFAHEIAHVDRRHTLQILYRAAMVPAIIAVISGDVSQVTSLSSALPALLLQAAYSRELEQQADDDAAVSLRKIGADPAAMGALIERIEAVLCGKDGCGPSWLGSHPEGHERAERLRHPRQ